MPVTDKIYSLDLQYNDAPMPFVMKTMEEIDLGLGGISDNPHRHNYYTVIWSFTATGKHVIDFKEYPIIPNHVFFVSPAQVHQIITDPKPTGYVILFTPEFLEKNSILYREDGSKRIADNALVALTLMIAESKPDEKDMMVKVVVNLINPVN